LHDIGKVKIPDAILNKPGPLTDAEFEIMKEHVNHGNELLQQTTNLDESAVCVTAHHHERLDGTGYPQGLRGDQISLFGQMSAIVDIYDALTSERCYKEPVAPTDALRKIYEWSNSYLNRHLAEKFISHIGIYPVGSIVRLVSGAIAVVIGHGEKDLLQPVVRIVYDWRHHRTAGADHVDLGRHATDQIARCEPSGRFNIDPADYLF
jgi:HD-GYP domain-containing protein (c-di-GMP phosphodiesterase class II)